MNPILEFEELVKKYTEAKFAIAVSNGTAALLTALNYFDDMYPKDGYVITTPYTFPATANAIIASGFKPLFVDIENYNISVTKIRAAMSEKVVGMVPVHLFGIPCDMPRIIEIAETYDVFVVEDCSQAFGARIDGKHVGTFGDAGTFSFYASKNLSTFEGGMVITNDGFVDSKSRKFINHGFNEKGEMIMFGGNYKMPWMNAFIGQQTLALHKKGIEAELGKYGASDGFYPKLVYQHTWYKNNPDKWAKMDCFIAEDKARIVSENMGTNSKQG